jgi:hypothetical protein
MTNIPEQEQIQDTLPTVEAEPTPVSTPVPPPVVTDIPPETPKAEDVRVEEFKVSGDALLSKVKELLHQANIRRIILKTEDGRTVIEIPLAVGIVGGVLSAAVLPLIAALGVIGVMVARLTVVIEKKV